jgi:hypothetical protein
MAVHDQILAWLGNGANLIEKDRSGCAFRLEQRVRQVVFVITLNDIRFYVAAATSAPTVSAFRTNADASIALKPVSAATAFASADSSAGGI